uniref:Uncharacterized protein n=1 Tax=Ditylenchus dipsaci TaxID=166011 RepID=A0A915ETS1_9BILA
MLSITRIFARRHFSTTKLVATKSPNDSNPAQQTPEANDSSKNQNDTKKSKNMVDLKDLNLPDMAIGRKKAEFLISSEYCM